VEYICFLLLSSQGTNVIQRSPGKMFFSRRDFFKPYPLEVRDPSRLLILAGDSEYLSKKLTWIQLQGFSSECLPNNFYLHDAVAIDLQHSLLRCVWKEPQVFITFNFLFKLVFVSTYNYFFFSFSSLIFY